MSGILLRSLRGRTRSRCRSAPGGVACAGGLGRVTPPPMTISKVLVVGAGTMGNGIAQVCAQSGLTVTMTDVSDAAAKKGLGAIEKSLDRLVQKGKLSADDRSRTLGSI